MENIYQALDKYYDLKIITIKIQNVTLLCKIAKKIVSLNNKLL